MESMSLKEVQSRWQKTIRHAGTLQSLRQKVRENGPDSPCQVGCRSVCWRAFLVFKTPLGNEWSSILSSHRSSYSTIKHQFFSFIKNPEALSLAEVDPLADDPKSPWNTVREDEAIRQEILQDVKRLPDVPFYHRDEIQALILDVLFVHAKLNPDTGYRQGMHEILGPMVYVVYQDAVNMSVPGDNPEQDSLMLQVLDKSFVEHDTYMLFSRLMEHCKPFYEIEAPSAPNSATSGLSPIVEKSKLIHEVYLMRVDPELATHLKDINVLPQIFLIRWIRLLFGREFTFNQHLIMWDTMFALDPNLKLVDLICVAMMLRLRWELIEADYPAALMMLLKYPDSSESQPSYTFVEDAVYLSTHLTPTGGATIVQKYTGKRVRPSGQSSLGLQHPRGPPPPPLRSPIIDPVRIFGQSEDVKGMLSVAAKTVLQRSEKLGINQAVRDAVEDIRRGWSDTRSISSSGGGGGGGGGGARTPAATTMATAALTAMETRNTQLALMLDEAFNDLKFLADENKSSKDDLEIVAAKIYFVKAHLEDSTLVLVDNDTPVKKGAQASTAADVGGSGITNSAKTTMASSLPSSRVSTPIQTSTSSSILQKPQVPETTAGAILLPQPVIAVTPAAKDSPAVASCSLQQQSAATTTDSRRNSDGIVNKENMPLPSTSENKPAADSRYALSTTPNSDTSQARQARPAPLLPTRSSIAQSSFAFMLEEPDELRSLATSESAHHGATSYDAHGRSGSRPGSAGSGVFPSLSPSARRAAAAAGVAATMKKQRLGSGGAGGRRGGLVAAGVRAKVRERNAFLFGESPVRGDEAGERSARGKKAGRGLNGCEDGEEEGERERECDQEGEGEEDDLVIVEGEGEDVFGMMPLRKKEVVVVVDHK